MTQSFSQVRNENFISDLKIFISVFASYKTILVNMSSFDENN